MQKIEAGKAQVLLDILKIPGPGMAEYDRSGSTTTVKVSGRDQSAEITEIVTPSKGRMLELLVRTNGTRTRTVISASGKVKRVREWDAPGGGYRDPAILDVTDARKTRRQIRGLFKRSLGVIGLRP